MNNEVLIFGHKSPDTDTICSAIVKQILNEKSGDANVKAVRLGDINKETRICVKLYWNRRTRIT